MSETDLNALAERLEREANASFSGDDFTREAEKALRADLRQAAQALRGMGEALEKITARREIYVAKRDMFDPLADSTDNTWDRYNFAVEACEIINLIARSALKGRDGSE